MRPTLWHLLPLLLASGCSAATARTIAVSTDAELVQAVKSARSGDTIALAPGDYAPLNIRNRQVEGAPVTISGKGARIAYVNFDKSSGWALDGLELGGETQERGRVVRIENSSRITVRNNLIRGINVNMDPWDDFAVGVGLRNADTITVIGNRFRDLGVGFIVGSSGNVRFEGNSVAYVREGSNWVAVKTATIRCNRFSHFFPNWIRKEHPDAIQGWWNKNGNNADFLIEGNVLNLGGPRAIQGIFLAGARLPEDNYELGRLANITIRDNIYYGSSLHGISLSGTVDAVIERNTVLPSPHAQQASPPPRSADGRRSSALVPRIRVLGDVSTGRITDNIAVSYQLPPLMEARNNLDLEQRSTSSSWKGTFVQPPTGDDPTDASFQVDPESAAGKAGQGARPICGNLLPPPVDAPSGPDPSTTGQPAQSDS